MKTIHREIVGAFIISADEKMLLGYNKKGGVYQGKLCVPGGGVEEGEALQQALRREVLEETGIDIDGAEIKELGESPGQSEKYIKELGEVVLVDMTFHDFEIRLSLASDQIALAFEDDFGPAEWYEFAAIDQLDLGPATRATLARHGRVNV